MSEATNDPAAATAVIWSNALELLRKNSSLTAREKGWFEGVVPEALFGTNIILAVENSETQHVLQTELNDELLQALRIANGGVDLFPAFKIAVRANEPEQPVLPVTALSEEAPRGDTRKRQPLPEPEPVPEPVVVQQPPKTTHYDDAVVQTFEDSMGNDLDPSAAAAMSTTLGGAADVFKGRFGRSPQPMIDPETHLNPSDTFDTFVPGDSNRFARTVALAVAEGGGSDFNPLCVYGGSGLGKTHLLNAIGNYSLIKQPGARVRYVTSEEFTNEFIDSLRMDAGTKSGSSRVTAFNRKYREVDVLLIDDIQFLGGKTETLEQFFHTFNSLYQANKRIVIASDVPPKNLKDFESRLISRFEQGITVDVKPPDLETRIAILRMIASNSGMRVPYDVLDLIAERFTENIRELEGALNRVTALASLNGQPVTVALAEQTLQDFFSTDIEVKPTDIIGRVAKYFHLTFDDIVGPQRNRNITLARQIAMYLTRDLTSMSLVNIGQVFGGRDHTTVMHNIKIVSDGMKQKQEIYNYVTELTVLLRQRNNK